MWQVTLDHDLLICFEFAHIWIFVVMAFYILNSLFTCCPGRNGNSGQSRSKSASTVTCGIASMIKTRAAVLVGLPLRIHPDYYPKDALAAAPKQTRRADPEPGACDLPRFYNASQTIHLWIMTDNMSLEDLCNEVRDKKILLTMALFFFVVF